jgi:hypothetical protein
MHTVSDRNNTGDDKLYKLRLNPASASRYNYIITNDSKTSLEVNDKKIENTRKTDVQVNYEINKDSLGDFLVSMVYDKIHLHTKNGDTETELDAANASTSHDPVEKMIGILKDAKIVATVTTSGQVLSMSGYQDITDKILSSVITNNLEDKLKAQTRWQQMIEQGFIKKNIDQLFKIFPDSAIHIGDKWKSFSSEKSEVSFNVKRFFTLKAINDGVADVESEGEITSDSAVSNAAGQQAVSDLKGKQQGIYLVDIKTGMLVSCNIVTNIEGTIQMMGRDVPVKIENSVKMEGRKLN